MQTFLDKTGQTIHFSTTPDAFSISPGHVLVILYSQNGWVFTHHKERGLEFPGGKKEQGETIEQAACREVWEETGARVSELQFIGQYKVEGQQGFFVKNVYFAIADSIESKDDYLETKGAVFMNELPERFSDDIYSFIMQDHVITISLERIKNLKLM